MSKLNDLANKLGYEWIRGYWEQSGEGDIQDLKKQNWDLQNRIKTLEDYTKDIDHRFFLLCDFLGYEFEIAGYVIKKRKKVRRGIK